MNWQRDTARAKIRAKISELAAELGRDARNLGDHDVIPHSGLLDSAAILGLIVWCETEFGIAIDFEELSIDNFGTVEHMLDFLEQRVPA